MADDDFCFICNKSLSEGDVVNVVRGLHTLKVSSVERNDGHINYLNTLTAVTVHCDCRRVYTRKSSIIASKRCLEEVQEDPSTLFSSSKKIKEEFDIEKSCLFCGQAADEQAERRKSTEYRRRVSKISTPTFRDNIIKRADERSDLLGELVKSRIAHEHDLVAAGAKYHGTCFKNFLKPPMSSIKLCHENTKVAKAMEEIFNYMESHRDSIFSLTDLSDIPTEYTPDKKTIIAKIQQKYLSDIVISTRIGAVTILCFHDAHHKFLLKAMQENKKKDSENKLQAVDAAAAIIRDDIHVNTAEYKNYESLDENTEIPETLLHFVKEIVLKNKYKNTENLKQQCTYLCQAIIRSFLRRQ